MTRLSQNKNPYGWLGLVPLAGNLRRAHHATSTEQPQRTNLRFLGEVVAIPYNQTAMWNETLTAPHHRTLHVSRTRHVAAFQRSCITHSLTNSTILRQRDADRGAGTRDAS